MEAKSNERMVLFSDAVIAITITLLVLELRLPAAPEHLTDGELWTGLMQMRQRLFAYGLSFIVIASFWIGHRNRFERIARNDGALTWLNMAFLLTVGLMPFVTGILAENGGALATALYGGLIAVVSLLLFLMGVYADQAGLSDKAPRRRPAWTGLVHTLVFGLSVPMAFFWDADLAKYFWIVLLPINVVLARLWPGEKTAIR